MPGAPLQFSEPDSELQSQSTGLLGVGAHAGLGYELGHKANIRYHTLLSHAGQGYLLVYQFGGICVLKLPRLHFVGFPSFQTVICGMQALTENVLHIEITY